jgi:hypothetical protein
VKADRPPVALDVHAVESQHVEMHVEIEGRPETLNDRHGRATATEGAGVPGTTPQEREHGADEDATHRPAERVVPRQHIPQPMQQAQHSLAHWHLGKHLIDGMRRAFGHAAAPAARAHRPALARERHETIQPAAGGGRVRRGRTTHAPAVAKPGPVASDRGFAALWRILAAAPGCRCGFCVRVGTDGLQNLISAAGRPSTPESG